jgi:hypothetical protein
VLQPNLHAWIEQWHKDVTERIKRADIRSLVAIATHARQCKVVLLGFTSMLTRHDVVWFVPMQRHRLWQQTILTTRVGPAGHQVAQSG